MNIKPKYIPFIWSSILFVICFGLMFLLISRLSTFIETSQIIIPAYPGRLKGAGAPALINIEEASQSILRECHPLLFRVAALWALPLFVPISKHWLLLRVLFGLGFAWGVFIFVTFFCRLLLPFQ
jgi:hypothetical protein